MPTLSMAQMQMYAAAAGLPNPRLWAAIGQAESGGRTDVVNRIGATGWLQINQPVHVRSHPRWTKQWLKNPANNAMAAKVIYDEQGLTAWEAYTNGSYQQFYGGAGTGAAQIRDPWLPGPLIPPDGSGSGLGGAMAGLGDALDILKDAGNWLSQPKNWVRIGYAVGGIALVVVGLGVMARPAWQPIVNAGKAAAGVTPVARGRKIVKTAVQARQGAADAELKARSAPEKAAAPKAAAKKTTAPARKAAPAAAEG